MGHGFEGQVAFVTGAASGIGRALALELSRAGAKVVAADLDADGATEVASACGGEAVVLDVTDADAFRNEIQKVVDREGRLDLLFNNAGIGLAGEVRDTSLRDWKRCIDVNLWGVIHGVAAAYPVMSAQGRGHIINTASGAGLVPRPGMAPYATAKHAVVGLSTSLRAEGAALGVRVSVACPGYIATNIMKSTRYVGLDKDRLLDGIPIKPMSADRCAQLILRGTTHNRAVICVSRLLAFEWFAYRVSPRLGCRLSQIRGRKFRHSRSVSG